STRSTRTTRWRRPGPWSARRCVPCATWTAPPPLFGRPACRPARGTGARWPTLSCATSWRTSSRPSPPRESAVRHDVSISNSPVDTSALRLPPGPVDLRSLSPASTPGFEGDKEEAKAALSELEGSLADLQERLWAERTTGSNRRVLLVLQG